MIKINLPVSEKEIRKLKVGDVVSLHGTIVTARDAAHKHMVEKWPEFVEPLLKNGAIYLHATGGAAPLIADTIKKVKSVQMLDELGVPEAFWEFEVDSFTGVVTMDSAGNSLHEKIFEETKKVRDGLIF